MGKNRPTRGPVGVTSRPLTVCHVWHATADSFMCVSGCPAREASAAAAMRMAALARDMIASVRAWKSSTGYTVEVRIGMHSGPTAAGVIGKRALRWGQSVTCPNVARCQASTCRVRMHVFACGSRSARHELDAAGAGRSCQAACIKKRAF